MGWLSGLRAGARLVAGAGGRAHARFGLGPPPQTRAPRPASAGAPPPAPLAPRAPRRACPAPLPPKPKQPPRAPPGRYWPLATEVGGYSPSGEFTPGWGSYLEYYNRAAKKLMAINSTFPIDGPSWWAYAPTTITE